jgi:hypothetical protein
MARYGPLLRWNPPSVGNNPVLDLGWNFSRESDGSLPVLTSLHTWPPPAP